MGTNSLPPAPTDLIDADYEKTMSSDDLDSHNRVDRLVRDFYRQVSKDERLGPIFNQVAEVDWTAHLDLMTSYWSRILLREPGYHGHIQTPHEAVHGRHKLVAEDFTRWYSLWTATIDKSYSGPMADQAKRHAANIATMLARRVAGIAWRPIAPEVLLSQGDGLYHVNESAKNFGTETLYDGETNPAGAGGQARTPDGGLELVIETAEERPGERIFIEVEG